MASVLTNDSVADLQLKAGDKVRVIIKAIHVLIVKE
jgi:molybdopterin-binding protein